MYFASRKDLLFFCIIWGIIFFLGWMYFYDVASVTNFIMSTCLIAFLLWIWFGTGYRIEGSMLKVTFGPFREKIAIHDITAIRRAHHPFTSPSLALRKLEITTSTHDVTYVSPKEEDAFLRALLEVNSEIRVDGMDWKENEV